MTETLKEFRKKPVVIRAAQWFKHGDHPQVVPLPYDPSAKEGWVKTLEGGHIVSPGDWIITGVQGEHYPCKPDIFAATYEPVSALAGIACHEIGSRAATTREDVVPVASAVALNPPLDPITAQQERAEDPTRLKQFVELLQEEMAARLWTARDLALVIAAKEATVKELEIELICSMHEMGDMRVRLNRNTLRQFDDAFGVSEGFFARLLGPQAAAGIASPSLQEQGWQAIETAPKDGTHVLLVGIGLTWREQMILWWEDGFWTDGEYHWSNAKFTHWRPLPLPPPSAKG